MIPFTLSDRSTAKQKLSAVTEYFLPFYLQTAPFRSFQYPLPSKRAKPWLLLIKSLPLEMVKDANRSLMLKFRWWTSSSSGRLWELCLRFVVFSNLISLPFFLCRVSQTVMISLKEFEWPKNKLNRAFSSLAPTFIQSYFRPGWFTVAISLTRRDAFDILLLSA